MSSSASSPGKEGRQSTKASSHNRLESEVDIDIQCDKETNVKSQPKKDGSNNDSDDSSDSSDDSGVLLKKYHSKNKNSKTEKTKKRKYNKKSNSLHCIPGGRSVDHTQHELLKHYKLAALESLKTSGKSKKRKKRKQQQQQKTKGEDDISSKGWDLSDLIPFETIHSLPDDYTPKDILSLDKSDKFDYIPEDYGINFWEEGQKPINEGHIIERMRHVEIYDLVGTANGCSSSSDVDPSYVNTSMNMNNQSYNNLYNAKKYMETRLWHMPYVPPKGTHLEFLLQCAGLKLHQTKKMTKNYALEDETIFERDIKLDNNLNSSDEEELNDEISFNSDDSTYAEYQPFRGFDLTKKIKEWKLKEENNNESSKSYKKIWNDTVIKKRVQLKLYDSFDETALVSLGLMVEESMIATLLPLAKHHVARCRFLEISKQKRDESETNNTVVPLNIFNDPFVQWTLPLHEAIANLCHPAEAKEKKWDNNDAFLPSSSVPSMDTLNNLSVKNQIDKASIDHGIGIDFIRENMDLFQYFVDGPTQNLTKEYLWSTQNVADDVKIALAHASSSNSNQNCDSDWPIPQIITPNMPIYDDFDEISSASSL